MHDPIKVYDARWEANEFTDDQVRRLFEATFAYGRLLGVDTVTLTRDARLAAGRVLTLALETAVRMGLRAFLRAEPISTPQSYFTTLFVSQEHKKTMGLTITASHNPRDYIGVKFTVPTVQAIGQDCGPMGGLTKIRQLYHSHEKFAPAPGGSLTLLDLTREYVDYSLAQAGVKAGQLSGLGVVLDTFNGSAGPELLMGLGQAGVKVAPLRLIPDGNFPTGSPNPISAGKMNAAIELCAKLDCPACVGIDGDGDRMVFGSGRGILTAGFAAVPILRACGLGTGPGGQAVLYDPKVSPLALVEWGKLNVRPVLFRNGHSQIKDYMRQVGAVAAVEESGHYYHRLTLGQRTISGENSLLTVLYFLEALHRQPRLMEELWQLQDQVFTTGEFNYQYPSNEQRDQALKAVIALYVRDGAAVATATADGIDLQGTCLSRGVTLGPGQVQLARGWYSGCLRIATNEKGVVRAYLSAGEAEVGRKLEQAARRVLQEEYQGKAVE